MTNLEKLDISNNRLTTEKNDDRLGALANLTSLNELNLSNNKGITALSAIAGLSNLTTLDISSTSITDFNVFWNESAARFANLTYLKATNIQGLESIAGLVQIVNQEGFNANGVIWNLNGSVLKADKDGHIKMITDKFTSGSFTAPMVINDEGVKYLGDISIEPNDDGNYEISFNRIEEAESYKVVLIDENNAQIAECDFSNNVTIELEDLIDQPRPSENIRILKVLALDANDQLLAESYKSISMKIKLSNSNLTAALDEDGQLNLKSETFSTLEQGDTVIINYHCTCDGSDHVSKGANLSRIIYDKEEDVIQGALTYPNWANGENHTGWNVKVMILKKTIFENDTYTINIIQFNDWRDQAVTMPEMVE